MVPIEYVWVGTVLLFALIGMARGFLKELGVTTVMVVLLFGLDRLERQLVDVGAQVVSKLPAQVPAADELFMLVLYTLVVIVVAFISYQGETLAFEGTARGVRGFLFGALTGAINGYLIAGTVWFYADKYRAVLVDAGVLRYDMTDLAQRMIPYMPPQFLERFLPFLVVFMIILRVIR